MMIKAQIKFTKQQIEQLDELRADRPAQRAQSWSAVQSTTTYAESGSMASNRPCFRHLLATLERLVRNNVPSPSMSFPEPQKAEITTAVSPSSVKKRDTADRLGA